MARPTKARLNFEALRHNFALVAQLAPRSRIMAVVKANAYGHGAVAIARQLAPLADALAVASIEEALVLREAGITIPILLLQGAFDASEMNTAAQLGLWLTVESEHQLQWLERATLNKRLNCWLKLDTGMHRQGIAPPQATQAYQRLTACPHVANEIVLYTHFAAADELDSEQTNTQITVFEKLCRPLSAPRSAANSPALLGWPAAHYEWVRPGYMLYGNSPFSVPHPNAAALQPVMTLVSAVTSLRDVAAGETVGYGATWVAPRTSRIATVTIGYGDGYPRQACNGTPVLVNGQHATLAGRVSMDMITVDVTGLSGVSIGDEVILWGPGLPVGEVARHAGTIGYELTTQMPARVPRVVTVE